MDGEAAGLEPAAARELATRALATAHGHPKLVELADGDAADPAALRERLAGAERAWTDAAVAPADFLAGGEPQAGADGYLTVLHSWARAVAATLPDAGRLLFAYLCCLEPDDRDEPTVTGNWERLWRRLERPGDPPVVAAALAPLTAHALVAVECNATGEQRAYRLHPMIADAGRTDAGPTTRAVVDRELAAAWMATLRAARKREGDRLGGLVLRAGRSALPYLARRKDWRELAYAVQEVLDRDGSPQTAAAMLPLLRRAVDAAGDGKHTLVVRRASARALEALRPAEATAEYRELLGAAVASHDHEDAHHVASDTIRVLVAADRLKEALALTEQLPEYARKAGLGPWMQMNGEVQRLQILAAMGEHEQVLAAIDALRGRMVELTETSAQSELINPFVLHEVILDTGRTAALGLERWERALTLSAERTASMRERGATALALANAEFNDYGPLLRLGRRDEAYALLLRCRQTFEQQQDTGGLGRALAGLAHVEAEIGHGDQAIRLGAAALRYVHRAGAPSHIGISHFNLANYLRRHGSDPREALAHRLAATIVAYQTGSGRLSATLHALSAETIAMAAPDLNWDEVCELTGRIEGVDLAALVARLPTRAADGPAALAEVLRLAAEIPPAPAHDVDRVVEHWAPVLSALLAARAGDARAAELLGRTLDAAERHRDWAALVGVLRRLAAGERRPELLDGLHAIHAAIAQRALDALDGRAAIDPGAWHALAPAPDGDAAAGDADS